MNTNTTDTILNGIDSDVLTQTIEAIKTNPEIAKFKFAASNRLVEGGLNRSEVKEFHGALQEHRTDKEAFVLYNDEPPVLLSEDKAPNPVEYVAQALLGCMTTQTNYRAASLGIEIESISSEVEGDIDLQGMMGLDPDVRSGYQELRATLRIKTKGPHDKLRELYKGSPVYDTLSRPVPIKVNVVFED